jgi:hypothetical protein
MCTKYAEPPLTNLPSNTNRTPPIQKKRFANFITVTFCLKLIAMHKKSFMPIYTKYSSDIDGDVNEARMVDIKCKNAEKTEYHVIHLK